MSKLGNWMRAGKIAVVLAAVGLGGCAEVDGALAPYFGVDFTSFANDYRDTGGVKYKDVYEDNLVGVNPVAGVYLTPNLAVEGGTFQTQTGSKSINGSLPGWLNGETKLKLSGWHGDVIGRLPLSNLSRTALLGSVGLLHVKGKGEITVNDGAGLSSTAQNDDSDTVWRVGAGVQERLTRNWDARVMVHCSPEMLGIIDHTVQVNAGVQYRF